MKTLKIFFAKNIPTTTIKTIVHNQGISSLTTDPLLHGANQSEQLKETEVPLIKEQLFGMLANLEYIGKFAGSRIVKGKLPIITSGKTQVKTKKSKEKEDFSLDIDIDKN